MITLTPLSGPFPSPTSYLLTIDSALILLDCGTFDHSPESPTAASSASSRAYLAKLKALAPQLHLVVLTHPLLSSLGLLPWLKAKCGLRCPVYATLPTREMGMWAVEEWVEERTEEERNQGREVGKAKEKELQRKEREKADGGEGSRKKIKGMGGDEDRDRMQVDLSQGNDDVSMAGEKEDEVDMWDVVWKVSKKEVRDAFLSVIAVRWTQPVHLSGPLKGYTLVAHRSGHTLGGSLFTLRPSLSSSLSPASSSSSMLYAPIFNHVKEHHLNGAALLNGAKIDDVMRRMGVVVVGAERSLTVNVKRVDRERALLDLITSTLNSSGSILMPTDPSARLLELLVLLESHWNYAHLGQRFPLCLISKTGKEVVGFVRSLTEWMGGQVGEQGGEAVLKFSNLRIYSSISELNSAIPSHVPKLILTVPSTLSHGYSRKLFVEFARSPNNVVILTAKGEEGTLARWLWGMWDRQQSPGEEWGKGKVGRAVELNESIELKMKRKVFLEGDELEAYHESIRLAAEQEEKHQAMLDRSRRMVQADGDSDDSDSDGTNSDDEVEEVVLDEESKPVVVRRRTGGFAGGAGAWDEFLDPLDTTRDGGVGKQSFDIFVKGAFSKRTTMTADGKEALARFRMFPVVERKRRVDAYGEAIDVEGWLRRGVDEEETKREAATAALVAATAAGKRAREEAEEEAKAEPPHKYVVEQIEAHLLCSLFVVDMEGRTDGRALKTILPQINPRKLVIVNGDAESVADLAETCRAVPSMTEDIYTPDVGECITVGEETKNFSIRLGDSIMVSLKMSRVDDYDVAYVAGVIHLDAESDIPVLERTSSLPAVMPPLTQLLAIQSSADANVDPSTSAAGESATMEITTNSTTNILAPLPAPLFIGDLRLTVLKDRLAAIGVPSEFAGEGVLVCGPAPPESFGFVSSSTSPMDARKGAKAIAESVSAEAAEVAGGKVAVRKTGKGRLVLDGTPGETYYVVRRTIYSLHAPAG